MSLCVLSHVRITVTPWIVACQAALSMELSSQEYWSGLPFPSPGDLPNQGVFPTRGQTESPALQPDLLPLSHLGSPSVSLTPHNCPPAEPVGSTVTAFTTRHLSPSSTASHPHHHHHYLMASCSCLLPGLLLLSLLKLLGLVDATVSTTVKNMNFTNDKFHWWWRRDHHHSGVSYRGEGRNIKEEHGNKLLVLVYKLLFTVITVSCCSIIFSFQSAYSVQTTGSMEDKIPFSHTSLDMLTSCKCPGFQVIANYQGRYFGIIRLLSLIHGAHSPSIRAKPEPTANINSTRTCKTQGTRKVWLMTSLFYAFELISPLNKQYKNVIRLSKIIFKNCTSFVKSWD